jgi:hypothetical protein
VQDQSARLDVRHAGIFRQHQRGRGQQASDGNGKRNGGERKSGVDDDWFFV